MKDWWCKRWGDGTLAERNACWGGPAFPRPWAGGSLWVYWRLDCQNTAHVFWREAFDRPQVLCYHGQVASGSSGQWRVAPLRLLGRLLARQERLPTTSSRELGRFDRWGRRPAICLHPEPALRGRTRLSKLAARMKDRPGQVPGNHEFHSTDAYGLFCGPTGL